MTRVHAALASLSVGWEVLFVDDSDDETPRIVDAEHGTDPKVRLVHRAPDDRANGLSGAVLRGIAEAHGDIVVVMDGDLQHPPEMLDALIEPLIDGRADIAVATRYLGDGRADGLRNWWRRFVSQSARRVVHVAFPRVRDISDPLGGFFAVRRDVVDGVDFAPVGFKILLEILVRGHWAVSTEVPYTFASRVEGSSKAGAREGVRFARHVGRLLPARSDDVVIDLRTDPPRIEIVRHRLQPRLVAVTLIVAAAFCVSLVSLASAVHTTSALAYLVVAAPLSLIVLTRRVRPDRDEPEIHDREVDALIGALLLAAAALLLFTGTRHAPALFWAHRVDLLAFPIFVAGAVALLLGTRTLWRARAAGLFALLTWPPAARTLVGGPITSLTKGTAHVVGTVADRLRIATTAANGQRLTVVHGDHAYLIRLSADARTAPTLVAFVLVAACIVIVRRDRFVRAVGLVAFGAVVAWAVRVAFVVLALFAGSVGQASVMRTLLGAWFDIVAVVVAVAAMVVGARTALPRRAGIETRPWRSTSGRMPRAIAAISVVAIAAAVVCDTQIERNDRLTTALGTPQLVGLSSAPTTPTGVTLDSSRVVSPAPATAPTDARWTRLRYTSDRSQSVVDVIDAPPSAGLDDTNVRAWYPVGWRTPVSSTRVHLSDGVDGRLLTFRGSRGTWLAMTWLWPVEIDGRSRIERVVVMPDAEPTNLSAIGTESRWLEAGEVPALRVSMRTLSLRIAQDHLRHAHVPDEPAVVSERR